MMAMPKAGICPLPILPALPAYADTSFFAINSVPHGKVEQAAYKNYAGEDKGMHVYLPPDYESSKARYPVIYFLHSDNDPGFERTNPHYKLMDFLSPRESEPVMHKDTRNVFTSTGLPALLMEKGVRRVVITGIQMEQCCETSARVGADLGYAVDFVTEATMTFPIPNHDRPGEELDVDAIRERTEYVLRRRFARITTVNAIAKELEGSQPSADSGSA